MVIKGFSGTFFLSGPGGTTGKTYVYKTICYRLRSAGKIIMLGGDFQKTLPILPNSSQEDIINVSLLCSYLWKQLPDFNASNEHAIITIDTGRVRFR